MKKLIIVLSFLIAFGPMTFAQKKKKGDSDIDVPASVLAAFAKKYRQAKKIVWSMDGENYRVDFKNNDKVMAASYNTDGKLQYTEVLLDRAQYNKTAGKYINENYPGYKVSSMRKRDTYDKKTTLITMLKKGKELLEVEFDKKGGFVRDTDKTPETAVSKKKSKKEASDEESNDEESTPPAKDKKSKASVKKSSSEDEDNNDEEAAPAKKETKAKTTPKKSDSEDEESSEEKPAAKKETKAKEEPKKKSTDADDDEDKPAAKKETKAKATPKKKSNDDDEEDSPPAAKKTTKDTKAKPAKKEKKKSNDDDDDE
jgi:hypothetical protein